MCSHYGTGGGTPHSAWRKQKYHCQRHFTGSFHLHRLGQVILIVIGFSHSLIGNKNKSDKPLFSLMHAKHY
jgi:hypothetical protein